MNRPSRLVFAAAVAAALILVPGASATPLDVHNPGFETVSPFEWVTNGSGTFTRDTSEQHAGAASLKLDTTAGFSAYTVLSNCFAATAGTTYFLSWWYNTTDSKVDIMSGNVSWYSTASCTSGLGSIIAQPTATVDPTGATWHQVGYSGAAPAGTLSAQVTLGLTCKAGQTGCVANDDDVLVNTVPTAVAVASLVANRSKAGVNVTWRTDATLGVLGFNVWRSGGPTGGYLKLNRSLIVAHGSAHHYRDRTARPGTSYVYKVEVVRLDGSRAWAGSVAIRN